MRRSLIVLKICICFVSLTRVSGRPKHWFKYLEDGQGRVRINKKDINKESFTNRAALLPTVLEELREKEEGGEKLSNIPNPWHPVLADDDWEKEWAALAADWKFTANDCGKEPLVIDSTLIRKGTSAEWRAAAALMKGVRRLEDQKGLQMWANGTAEMSLKTAELALDKVELWETVASTIRSEVKVDAPSIADAAEKTAAAFEESSIGAETVPAVAAAEGVKESDVKEKVTARWKAVAAAWAKVVEDNNRYIQIKSAKTKMKIRDPGEFKRIEVLHGGKDPDKRWFNRPCPRLGSRYDRSFNWSQLAWWPTDDGKTYMGFKGAYPIDASYLKKETWKYMDNMDPCIWQVKENIDNAVAPPMLEIPLNPDYIEDPFEHFDYILKRYVQIETDEPWRDPTKLMVDEFKKDYVSKNEGWDPTRPSNPGWNNEAPPEWAYKRNEAEEEAKCKWSWFDPVLTPDKIIVPTVDPREAIRRLAGGKGAKLASELLNGLSLPAIVLMILFMSGGFMVLWFRRSAIETAGKEPLLAIYSTSLNDEEAGIHVP